MVPFVRAAIIKKRLLARCGQATRPFATDRRFVKLMIVMVAIAAGVTMAVSKLVGKIILV